MWCYVWSREYFEGMHGTVIIGILHRSAPNRNAQNEDEDNINNKATPTYSRITAYLYIWVSP